MTHELASQSLGGGYVSVGGVGGRPTGSTGHRVLLPPPFSSSVQPAHRVESVVELPGSHLHYSHIYMMMMS